MFAAIGELWASLFTVFSMVNQSAAALDALAGMAKAEAEGLAEVMNEERSQRFAELKAKRNKS
jgi:hypothetical protein